MISAGSPGNRCCSEKIRIDTKNSVGTTWAMRRAKKFSICALVSRALRSGKRCTADPGPICGGTREWVPDQHCTAGALQCIRNTRGGVAASLQLQPGHAHQAVGHLLIAFQLVGMRDDKAAMIEIEDRLILHLELGQ